MPFQKASSGQKVCRWLCHRVLDSVLFRNPCSWRGGSNLCGGTTAVDSEPPLPLLWRGWTFCFFVPVKSQSLPVDGGVLANATVIPPSPRSRTTISAVLRWAGFPDTGLALINLGAEGSFLDKRWAIEQGIPLLDLDDITAVFALDGRALSSVHCISCLVSLTISGNH